MVEDSPHILSAFDKDLEYVQAQIVKMGGLVEAALLDASKALADRDAEIAERVRVNDRAIDELMVVVNEEAARIIAQRAPVATDLRILLSVIRLSGSLERIGDYAKNIAKRTAVITDMRKINGIDAALRRMAREVEIMLRDTLDAFIQRDTDMANEVRLRDEAIDQMYNALFRELLTFMMEDPRNISACMHLHFIAKNIERMGDLITNMSEQIIYLVTGEIPDDERPKDTSVYDATEQG